MQLNGACKLTIFLQNKSSITVLFDIFIGSILIFAGMNIL